MKASSLLSTERKLILIFVIGAFSFLLIFEAFFIGMRLILEERFQRDEFITQTQWVDERGSATERSRWLRPPRIGINSVALDNSGNIVNIRGNIEDEEFSEFFEDDILRNLETGQVINHDGMFILKKRQKIQGQDLTVVFFKKSGYPLEDIIRDMMRFIAMDILLLIPFYLVGRYFVRRTLEPVAANIDTMSHFIHDAGHELKTPLAIVSGNLQILRDSPKPDTTIIEESLSTIHSMADSLDGLVELANLKAPTKTSTLNLKENIEEVISLQHEHIKKKSLTIELDIPGTATVSIEKKHFQILFSNLITNAIRYNKDGGDIRVTFAGKRLTVTDTWIGMTDEQQKKIFERFYRADRSGKIPGTGIWLTIVERIVRLYGWDISVESTAWAGTSFTITMR
jgi:signal transduction histidine kinase